MHKRLTTLFAALAALAALASCSCSGNAEEEEIVEEKFCPYGFDTDLFEVDSTQVLSGETFTTMMTRLGMAPAQAYTMTKVCGSVFDARKVILGAAVEAYYTQDSTSKTLNYVVYHNNRIKSTIFQTADSLAVWTYEKPVLHEHKYCDVTITTSLWNDMLQAGTSPILIMDLADIYQWSVNFFTLQSGDRFQVIYDQSVCDGEVFSIDTVHFSLFTSGKLTVPAVRYQLPGAKGATFWGKGGESLKKMFLKAPLRYNRVSSGFTYHRKHPITGKVRPHTGVDYAAPKGTPVHAIGNGTVTLCGWDSSGGGKRIKIKHTQGYESAYLHLNGFAKGIRSGVRVSQGQLIGYVGSTGRSTGPHLDFRIWHNGKPLNPLTLNSPASDPLPKKYLDDFEKIYDSYLLQLDSLSR